MARIKTGAFIPPSYTPREAYAVRATAKGEATDEQQRLAMDWIIKKACATYDWPWRPGDQFETSVACGRQFVGQQIVKMINLNPEVLKDERNKR